MRSFLENDFGDLEWQRYCNIQGGSNMTGTDLYVNKPHLSRSYLNHLVCQNFIYVSYCSLTRILFAYVVQTNALIKVYINFIVSYFHLNVSVIH
jgi:hypothetical protein